MVFKFKSFFMKVVSIMIKKNTTLGVLKTSLVDNRPGVSRPNKR